jgi:hypothetical protein
MLICSIHAYYSLILYNMTHRFPFPSLFIILYIIVIHLYMYEVRILYSNSNIFRVTGYIERKANRIAIPRKFLTLGCSGVTGYVLLL